jgi:hypothetical protein
VAHRRIPHSHVRFHKCGVLQTAGGGVGALVQFGSSWARGCVEIDKTWWDTALNIEYMLNQ